MYNDMSCTAQRLFLCILSLSGEGFKQEDHWGLATENWLNPRVTDMEEGLVTSTTVNPTVVE